MNFKPITMQDVFNAAWQAFIIEDAPPAAVYVDNKGYGSAYVTKDGRKCAVGLCLPDGHPALQSTSGVKTLIYTWPNLFDPSNTAIEYYNLQNTLHDAWVDRKTGQWRDDKEFRRYFYINIARKYGLKVPNGVHSTTR